MTYTWNLKPTTVHFDKDMHGVNVFF